MITNRHAVLILCLHTQSIWGMFGQVNKFQSILSSFFLSLSLSLSQSEGASIYVLRCVCVCVCWCVERVWVCVCVDGLNVCVCACVCVCVCVCVYGWVGWGCECVCVKFFAQHVVLKKLVVGFLKFVPDMLSKGSLTHTHKQHALKHTRQFNSIQFFILIHTEQYSFLLFFILSMSLNILQENKIMFSSNYS